MTVTHTRARRLIAVGVFAVAAAAAPLATAASTVGSGSQSLAGPPCLAWFGNKEDGNCLSYSNGQPAVGGFPPAVLGGPASDNSGLTTGPLLPGTTINQPIG